MHINDFLGENLFFWGGLSIIFVLLLLACLVCLIGRLRRCQKRVFVTESVVDPSDGRLHSLQLRNAMQTHIARDMEVALSDVLGPLAQLLSEPSLDVLFSAKLQILHDRSVALKEVYKQMRAVCEQENYASSLELSCYQAEKICDIAIHSFRELLGTSQLKLTYVPIQSLLMIWVDYKKMEFVLSSLLAHAFQSIDYRGWVDLSVNEVVIESKSYCCFSIREVGDQFTSTCSAGVEFLKEIVGAHHGMIKLERIESELLYQLFIPLGKDHFAGQSNISFTSLEETQAVEFMPIEMEGAVLSVANENDAKCKIVVIEDNAHIRLYLNFLLSKKYTVYLTDNGEEGVKMVNEVMPDLVLSDVMMPVMNGFECCKVLKEGLDTCHIPIILITALTDNKDVIRGLELGADDYITKPFNPEVLETKIKRLLASRESLKEFYTTLFTPVSGECVDDTPTLELVQDPFVNRLLDIITVHFTAPEFNVKQLADIACMSQPTLYRKVKQLTGYTVVELIRGVRLKESAILLKTKQYSIPEVAERVGYNDVPTFRKHFVELYGTTPSSFVKQHYLQNK
ncbi:MAG: response regulator transcription factor [Bacteroidales bacterium]